MFINTNLNQKLIKYIKYVLILPFEFVKMKHTGGTIFHEILVPFLQFAFIEIRCLIQLT